MTAVIESGWSKQKNSDGNPTVTLAIAEPTGLATGDWCLIIAMDDENTTYPQYDDSTNKPTGFTLVDTGGSSVSDAVYAIFKRKITGGESWPITLTANTQDDTVAFALRVTGANADDCIDAVGTTWIDGSADALHPITALTTGVDDCLAIYVLAADGGDTDSYPHSVDAGWTEQDQEYATVGSNGVGGSWGTKTVATAGTTGTATVTLSSNQGAAGVIISIAPADTSIIPQIMHNRLQQGNN